MFTDASLQSDLRQAVASLERLPLPELLQRQGLLLPLLRQLACERLMGDLRVDAAGSAADMARISRDLGCDPPPPLAGEQADDWIAGLPPELQAEASRRWRERLLRLALEQRYGNRLEDHFLRRRAGLERVVFRLMRLRDPGLADELYLRLIDDGVSFGDLAAAHALGEERHCRGLVGPLPVSQPHAAIRAALAALAPGEVHPPLRLEAETLLLRLEQRLSASLDADTRQQLAEELLEQELAASLPGCLEALMPLGGGER